MTDLSFLIFVILSLLHLVSGALKVWNDGPATIGAPITFFAEMDDSIMDTYLYEFRDHNNDSIHYTVFGRDRVDVQFTYDKVPEEPKHRMDVDVYVQFRGTKLWKYDNGHTNFDLSNYLVGNIIRQQEGVPKAAIDRGIMSSKKPATFTFELHDPNEFFKSFTKSFSWKINGEPVNNATTNVLTHVFDNAAWHNISVFASAQSPDKKMDRHIEKPDTVLIQDSIQELKINGKYFLFRNQSLDLNITCNQGTGEFSFCKEISEPRSFYDVDDNCTQALIKSKICNFHVGWYFQYAGKYNLTIRIWNDVSEVYNRIELSVMEITKQASLSFVVVPVVSCIVTIIIIVFAIAFHVQHRERFTVEVADFDFQAHDESVLLEKTFWVRLRDSMNESLGSTCFRPSRRDRDSGIFDDPHHPLQEDADDGYASTSVHVRT